MRNGTNGKATLAADDSPPRRTFSVFARTSSCRIWGYQRQATSLACAKSLTRGSNTAIVADEETRA